MNKRKEKAKFLEAKGDIGTATSSEEKQACKGALQRVEGVEVNIYATPTKKQMMPIIFFYILSGK